MKLRLLMALASAALFLAPSTAGALDSQQDAGRVGPGADAETQTNQRKTPPTCRLVKLRGP